MAKVPLKLVVKQNLLGSQRKQQGLSKEQVKLIKEEKRKEVAKAFMSHVPDLEGGQGGE